ncbi:DUF7351 domain-containing protein [Halolamina sp. C58]|uniref:winged helix-turn-helix domain-containing protein n=1 Tax=Halolamina sp. C58 TaxID=3421640 RepID=UPI003EBF905E
MSENAFAALGSEHRVEILRTLVVAVEEGAPGLPFTELYDRTGIDSSSQFSYHLDRLTAEFVREVDGNYRPTSAGERVVRSIRAGMYTGTPSFDPVTVEGLCPACESTTLRAEYDDPHLQVACGDCGETVVTYDLSPAEAEGRDAMETLRACNRRALREYRTAIAGSCPTCYGLTTVAIEAGPDDGYACVATCSQCDLRLFAPVELPLFGHPAVVSFYWEHGVDVTELPLWRLPEFIGDADRRVRDREPLALDITLHHGESSLAARIDADGTVSVDDRSLKDV